MRVIQRSWNCALSFVWWWRSQHRIIALSVSGVCFEIVYYAFNSETLEIISCSLNNQPTDSYASLPSSYDLENAKIKRRQMLVLKYKCVQMFTVCFPSMLSGFPKVWNIGIYSFRKLQTFLSTFIRTWNAFSVTLTFSHFFCFVSLLLFYLKNEFIKNYRKGEKCSETKWINCFSTVLNSNVNFKNL